ncbi:MAG: ATP-binding protein [Nitrospirota bacterium]
MKIIYKQMTAFLVFVFLIWAVGYFSVTSSKKALQESIVKNSVLLATQILNEIDRDIYEKMQLFQEYSKDLILQGAVLESNREFGKMDNIRAYIDEKENEWTSVPKEKLTPFMQKILNNESSEELREKTEFYEEKNGFDVFSEVFATNKYGAVASMTRKAGHYRQDNEEWWQVTKEKGFYAGDIRYDEAAGIYVIDIGIRVEDESGGYIGAIKVGLNIELMTRSLEELKEAEASGRRSLPGSMRLKLATKDGRLIYSSEQFKFLEDISRLLQKEKHLQRVQGERTLHFIREGNETGGGQALSIHTHSKGYKDYSGLGWILMVDYETEDIFSSVVRLRNRISIFSIIVAALTVLIAFAISRSLSRPIEKLRDVAIDFGRGNMNTRFEVSSKDEIGVLGDSFNKMIAERRRMDEELRKLNEELEIKVQERTKQLVETQEELVRKEKLAALGQLAASVGHELRNPLGVISNAAYFLKTIMPDAGDTTKEYLDIIKNEVSTSERIVSALLDLARAKTPRLAPITVNELINLSLEKCAVGEKITLRLDIPETLPSLEVDPLQMGQVFQNLITNAVHAMPGGGILAIKAEEGKEKGDIRISVSDTGVGISPDNMGKLFQAFFSTKARGIGLGLAISKDLVETNRGKIEATSQLGKGTTFTVTLPAAGKGQ